MADSIIANSLADTSVTAGNDDDPDDVLRRNLQHLLCQAEESGQTIKMYQDECDELDDKCIAMETIRDKLADKCIASRRRHKRKVDELEDAWRRHHSDKEKIQELKNRLRREAKNRLRREQYAMSKEYYERSREYYQRNRERILAKQACRRLREEKKEYYQRKHKEYYQRNREQYHHRSRENRADAKMLRILKLQERDNTATLDEIGQKFINTCRNAATRDALARLLAASDGSVGTSASASGSSEALSASWGHLGGYRSKEEGGGPLEWFPLGPSKR